MKKEEANMTVRKSNVSEFDLSSPKIKEPKLPRKIFTFGKENLQKIEAEKNTILFECEIIKIAQKGQEKRFFRFINNAILYSKVMKKKKI